MRANAVVMINANYDLRILDLIVISHTRDGIRSPDQHFKPGTTNINSSLKETKYTLIFYKIG